VSFKKLDVWQLARELVVDIHRMSLEYLPKFEMYEVGSQIRRSIIWIVVIELCYPNLKT